MAGVKRLLDTANAATYLDLEQGTLENWRYQRKGPPCVKFGRLVRYDLKDLDKWIDDQKGAA